MDGDWNKEFLGGLEMLDAHEIYLIAKSYRAEITENKQIQWRGTANSPGSKWVMRDDYLPSVMDSVILNKSWRVPGYLAAAKAATGWSNTMVLGFLEGMLLGRPLKTEEMKIENFQHWKGMLVGLMVIQKLKSRLWEAESLFT